MDAMESGILGLVSKKRFIKRIYFPDIQLEIALAEINISDLTAGLKPI
jgi:hypothetical protein